jgi:fructokinase
MILVCGEALVDLFLESTDPRGPTLKVAVGGSPLNLAIGLARLGVATAFVGGVSVDYFGTILVEAMLSEGISISLLKRSAQPTPLVLVSPDAHGHPSYTFYAQDSAVHDVRPVDVSGPLPPEVTAIALGSYALAAEPVGRALLSLVEREAQRTVIALDCNLRPTMVGPLLSWRQRLERFARCASIIKLSDEDFAQGWGESAQPDVQAADWLQCGAKLVIMTHGARGSTAWHRSGRVSVAAFPVQVVDTVGAGDSFQAALLARLAQNGLLSSSALSTLDRASIVDACRFASLAAGLTCTRRGANLPRRAEVESLMDGKKGM